MSVIAKFKREKAGVAGDQPHGPIADPNGPSVEASALSAMDRAVKPRRITPMRAAVVLVILAVLSVGVFGYLRYGMAKSLAVALDHVTVSRVEKATFSDYVPVTGNVAPLDTVFLDTVDGGQVTDVLVEDGAIVEAGRPLARLKNTRLELEVLSREAQLTETESYLANAKLAFQQGDVRNDRDLIDVDRDIARITDSLARQKPLENEGISKSIIVNLEADLAHSQAQRDKIVAAQAEQREVSGRNLAQLQQSIDRMTRSLDLVRENLNNLNIAAPIAGQLTGFTLKVGEVVNPSQRIGQVDSTDAFKITALVDEFYLGRVAAGQAANLELDGATYAMTVAKVYPDVKERQFQVDLRFKDAAPKSIRRGQTMRPRIELGETTGSVVVANGPFYDETGGTWALVMSSDGKQAIKRKVTLGRRNPEAIEVVSGLAPGERVITSSYDGFKDVERIDFN
ncbi:MAG TPA: HlyD family efflux transporter periplasmic adaptor subunit [Hyphomonadaceae bacterium]|nr:HlyD family efflux transporter periplasmic adaptor subunit [Hyphomonadaceae bacterium]